MQNVTWALDVDDGPTLVGVMDGLATGPVTVRIKLTRDEARLLGDKLHAVAGDALHRTMSAERATSRVVVDEVAGLVRGADDPVGPQGGEDEV